MTYWWYAPICACLVSLRLLGNLRYLLLCRMMSKYIWLWKFSWCLVADTQKGGQMMVLSKGIFTDITVQNPYCLLTQAVPFLIPGYLCAWQTLWTLLICFFPCWFDFLQSGHHTVYPSSCSVLFQWYTPEACLQFKEHFHAQVRTACQQSTGPVG